MERSYQSNSLSCQIKTERKLWTMECKCNRNILRNLFEVVAIIAYSLIVARCVSQLSCPHLSPCLTCVMQVFDLSVASGCLLYPSSFHHDILIILGEHKVIWSAIYLNVNTPDISGKRSFVNGFVVLLRYMYYSDFP